MLRILVLAENADRNNPINPHRHAHFPAIAKHPAHFLHIVSRHLWPQLPVHALRSRQPLRLHHLPVRIRNLHDAYRLFRHADPLSENNNRAPRARL